MIVLKWPNQPISAKSNLSNQTYQAKYTDQTFKTKPSKPSLPNQTYETNSTKPNLQNQTYQTKPNQNMCSFTEIHTYLLYLQSLKPVTGCFEPSIGDC